MSTTRPARMQLIFGVYDDVDLDVDVDADAF
jgi:hypothetical protein